MSLNLNSPKGGENHNPSFPDTPECHEILYTLFSFYKHRNEFLRQELSNYIRNYDNGHEDYTVLFRQLMTIIACKTAEMYLHSITNQNRYNFISSFTEQKIYGHTFGFYTKFMPLLVKLNLDKDIALSVYKNDTHLLTKIQQYLKDNNLKAPQYGLQNSQSFYEAFLLKNVGTETEVNWNLKEYKNPYRHLSLDQGLTLENKNLDGSLGLGKTTLGLIPQLIAGLIEELDNFFPRPIAKMIVDYLMLSIIDKISFAIKRLFQNHHETVYTCPAIQQDAKSENCGYWSLFNALRFIAEDQLLPTWSRKEKLEYSIISKQFDAFERWARDLLQIKAKDLTVVELEYVFEYILKAKDSELQEYFSYWPLLHENLRSMQDTVNMSPYTIINSTLAEDQKITFGGNIPHIKFQGGLNFLRLSELLRQKEKVLHCLFIGVGQHWWVEFLLSFSPELRFISIDSASQISTALGPQVNMYIENTLKNSGNYMKNIAQEMMPLLMGELKFLFTQDHHLNNDQESLGYKYCHLLVQFFSSPMLQDFCNEYLSALQLAERFAFQCVVNGYDRFTELHQKLQHLLLKNLSSKNNQPIGLFSETASSTVSTTPQPLSFSS